MSNSIYKYIINIAPVTKKNSQQIVYNKKTGRYFVVPSAAYKNYEKLAKQQLTKQAGLAIDYPVEITCKFYMATRRRVDLTNLLEAADDVLVAAGIIADDNHTIIVSHDGSRVLYDRDNPRTEIQISPCE